MRHIQQFVIVKRNIITRLEKKGSERCYVCEILFKLGDHIHTSNGKNPKYYHEDCYGRLLH